MEAGGECWGARWAAPPLGRTALSCLLSSARQTTGLKPSLVAKPMEAQLLTAHTASLRGLRCLRQPDKGRPGQAKQALSHIPSPICASLPQPSLLHLFTALLLSQRYTAADTPTITRSQHTCATQSHQFSEAQPRQLFGRSGQHCSAFSTNSHQHHGPSGFGTARTERHFLAYRRIAERRAAANVTRPGHRSLNWDGLLR